MKQRPALVLDSFWRNEQLEELSESSGHSDLLKLTYIGLLSVADSLGRFEWRPRQIGILLFGYSSARQAKMPALMDSLASGGFIDKYEDDGRLYGVFPHYADHNRLKNPKSKLPAPPTRPNASTETVPTRVAVPVERVPSLEVEVEVEDKQESKPAVAEPPVRSSSFPEKAGQEKPRQLPISLSNPPKYVVDDGPKFHPLKWAWFSDESNDSLRRVVYFHWKVSENDYWRKKANVRSAGQLQRAEKQMEQQTPGDFVVPGSAFMKVMVPDPNCTKCRSRHWEPKASDSDELVQKATGTIERVEQGEVVREKCDCLIDIGPKWLRELR